MNGHIRFPGVSRIRPLLSVPCSKSPSRLDSPPDTKTAFTLTLPTQVRAQAHRPALTGRPPHSGPPAFAHAPPTARLLLLCLKSLACFKNQLRDSGATQGARGASPDRRFCSSRLGPEPEAATGAAPRGLGRRRGVWSRPPCTDAEVATGSRAPAADPRGFHTAGGRPTQPPALI